MILKLYFRNGSGQLPFLFFCVGAYIEQVNNIWGAEELWKAEEEMRSEQKQFVFFLAGFLIGVLYIYFLGNERGSETDFLSVQNLMQVTYIDIDYKDYLGYLLRKRGGILLILVLISLALPGKYLLSGFLMILGCSMGSMLSVLAARYGFKGILLFLALIFPQDIVYIPTVFLWVVLLSGWNEGLFFSGDVLRRKRYGEYGGAVYLLFLCGVTIIGVLLECYVNPIIVNWCLKIF